MFYIIYVYHIYSDYYYVNFRRMCGIFHFANFSSLMHLILLKKLIAPSCKIAILKTKQTKYTTGANVNFKTFLLFYHHRPHLFNNSLFFLLFVVLHPSTKNIQQDKQIRANIRLQELSWENHHLSPFSFDFTHSKFLWSCLMVAKKQHKHLSWCTC